MKDVLMKGAIPLSRMMEVMKTLDEDNNIGAMSSFLGIIRADIINENKVKAIDYTSYEPMAIKVFGDIKKRACEKFDLSRVFIYHSIGKVYVGESSLLVVTLAVHRRASLEGLDWIVEVIKKEVPVFGKEVFEDGNFQWKVNRK